MDCTEVPQAAISPMLAINRGGYTIEKNCTNSQHLIVTVLYCFRMCFGDTVFSKINHGSGLEVGI